jgi:2Fe-2S ferredoxin
MEPKATIRFTVTHRGVTHEVSTSPHEYRSLMALLYDKFYFEDFGECKGIGRCGTCHVILEEAQPDLLMRSGNEQTTLSKMENVSVNSRLSCQILITEAMHGLRFSIVEEDDPGLY